MPTLSMVERVYLILKEADRPLSAREIAKLLPKNYGTTANVGRALVILRGQYDNIVMEQTGGRGGTNLYSIANPNIQRG